MSIGVYKTRALLREGLVVIIEPMSMLRVFVVQALMVGFPWAVTGCATAPTIASTTAPKPADIRSEGLAQADGPELSHDLDHPASGMRFPIEVEGFQRDGMSRYDQRGDDVSVGYHRLDEQMALTATVYIFPSDRYGGDIDVQFAEARDAVLRNRRGAELIGQGDMKILQLGEYRTGRRAHFLVKDPTGERPLAVSHLFLFVHGSWFIKYRATFPAHQHEQCDDALLRFMAALPWPEVARGVLAAR